MTTANLCLKSIAAPLRRFIDGRRRTPFTARGQTARSGRPSLLSRLISLLKAARPTPTASRTSRRLARLYGHMARCCAQEGNLFGARQWQLCLLDVQDRPRRSHGANP